MSQTQDRIALRIEGPKCLICNGLFYLEEEAPGVLVQPYTWKHYCPTSCEILKLTLSRENDVKKGKNGHK